MLRAYLINSEREKSSHKLNQDDLFKRTSKELNLRYWKEIDNQIQSFQNDSTFTTFVVLLDKNHPPQDLDK